MRSLHAGAMRAVGAVAGVLAAVLGAVTMTVAAIAGPVFGLAAVLLEPVRALLARRRSRTTGGPGAGGPSA